MTKAAAASCAGQHTDSVAPCPVLGTHPATVPGFFCCPAALADRMRRPAWRRWPTPCRPYAPLWGAPPTLAGAQSDAGRRQTLYNPRHALVAQLDRVLPSEGRGHRFDSCRVRHFPLKPACCKTQQLALISCQPSSHQKTCPPCGLLGRCAWLCPRLCGISAVLRSCQTGLCYLPVQPAVTCRDRCILPLSPKTGRPQGIQPTASGGHACSPPGKAAPEPHRHRMSAPRTGRMSIIHRAGLCYPSWPVL